MAPGGAPLDTPPTFVDGQPTTVDGPRGQRAAELRTLVDPPKRDGLDGPTHVDRKHVDTPPPLAPPPSPVRAVSARSPGSSQPLQVISMKTPVDHAAARAPEPPAKVHRVEIRDLSTLRNHRATPPQGLGNLAPPRDERQARARKRQDLVLWGSIAVIVGSFVTLGIWFLAR